MSIQPQGGAPSFNRPELVRYDSLRDSKDLGRITDIKAHLSGFVGAEAGTQSLFFSFELVEPASIQVQALTDSKWTQRFVSVGLRSEAGSISLDERGNARGVDVVGTASVNEALALFPPGKYTVVVSCSQWQTTPFGLILRVNPTTRLYANLTGRGAIGAPVPRPLVAVVRLEAALTGLGQLRAPGSGLFSGRRDRPLGSGPLTGRGRLTGTLSIREPLRSLAGAFLTGRGGLGSTTLVSNALGPRMWVSRLVTLTDNGSAETRGNVGLTAFDYSLQTFYFLPAGSPSSQRRLAVVYRAPNGQVLWQKISTNYVETEDGEGWRIFTLPTGDFLVFRISTGMFFGSHRSVAPGILCFRIGLDGTVYWTRNIQASFSAPTPGVTFVNQIDRVEDVTYHFGVGRIVFSCIVNGSLSLYIYVDPSNGQPTLYRGIRGGTMNAGSTLYVHQPLIKPDGRIILTGARVNGSPSYTWLGEADANLNTLSVFYKYTTGSTTTFQGASVLHNDLSVTIIASDSTNERHQWLRLNPDFSIKGRVNSYGAIWFGRMRAVVDAFDVVHFGADNGIASRDAEGNLTYRELYITGVPGRIDYATVRPNTWFKLDSRWGIITSSGGGAPSGAGSFTVGFELDMAPTVVTNSSWTITVGRDQQMTQARTFSSTGIERVVEIPDGGLTPITLETPAFTSAASPAAWSPNFIDASALLSWQLTSSPIKRGLTGEFPQTVIKLSPTLEPDPYRTSVVLHLPGSGVADTQSFVDYSPFGHQPTVAGGVKHSTEQAKFPDLGGFFERTSIKFDGTGDAIIYAPSPAFRFGRSDFTIEAWIFRPPGGPAEGVLFSNSSPGDPADHANSFYLIVASDGTIDVISQGRSQIALFSNGNLIPGSPNERPAVPLNTWTHIALCREAQIFRCYVNGRTDITAWRADVDLTAGAFMIGRAAQVPNQWTWAFGSAISSPFVGFMQDIRVTLGVARYHRAFTPRNTPFQYTPAGPPFSLPAGSEPAESGSPLTDLAFNQTPLFLRMNGNTNTFLDDSPYAHTVIPAGNAQQLAGGKWGGNQGVFDGFGDSLQIVSSPNLILGAGDLTIEMWARRIGDGQGPEFFQALIDSRTAEPSSQICLRINRAATGRQLCLYVDGAIKILGQPMAANIRYHIALVRSSGVFRLYMNGVQVGSSWTDATNYTATDWTIARGRFTTAGDLWEFHGHLNDLRLVRSALYTSGFTPPTRPIGDPPTATARYWRLFDLEPYSGFFNAFSLSELALHRGRNRIPNTPCDSSPAPSGGLITNTQDLNTTINVDWPRTTMEQASSYIELDAGTPVTADAIRLATVNANFSGISGFSLKTSNDRVNWTTLGRISGIALVEAALTPRLGLMPLPTSQSDPHFDSVVLQISANESGAAITNESPYGLAVTNVNVTKSTVQSYEGGQSLLFSAASGAYLTLAGFQGRSVFFTFGTESLTVEMAIFPLTIPPSYFVLFDTSAVGEGANPTNGFVFVLNNQRRLDLYINGQYRAASAASIPLNQWSYISLTRDARGIWRYTINGVTDTTTYTDARDLSNRTFTIGRLGPNTGDLMLYNGYMDNIRITRGVARGFTFPVRRLGWYGTGRGRSTGTLTA